MTVACSPRGPEKPCVHAIDDRGHVDKVDGRVTIRLTSTEVPHAGRIQVRVPAAGSAARGTTNRVRTGVRRYAEDVQQVVHARQRAPSVVSSSRRDASSSPAISTVLSHSSQRTSTSAGRPSSEEG